MGIVGRDAVCELNSLVACFQGHFFNKRCAGGDVFAVPEARREHALTSLQEAGYVVTEAKAWVCFWLLPRAEREACTVSVLGVEWAAVLDLIHLLLSGPDDKWLLMVSAWGLPRDPNKAVFEAVFGSVAAAKRAAATCQNHHF